MFNECVVCGKPMKPRKGKRFCSGTCRVKGYVVNAGIDESMEKAKEIKSKLLIELKKLRNSKDPRINQEAVKIIIDNVIALTNKAFELAKEERK